MWMKSDLFWHETTGIVQRIPAPAHGAKRVRVARCGILIPVNPSNEFDARPASAIECPVCALKRGD
jgi:hypothetical protein